MLEPRLLKNQQVCVTLILEALEYVALNSLSFHNNCLEIMLFDLFIPRRVT
jgi:hypothetical protein